MKSNKKYKNFLEKDYPPPAENKACFQIVSAPYEDNISYGRGTAKGPEAIIAASQYLEIFGDDDEPAKLGIYTRPKLRCKGSPTEVLKEICDEIKKVLCTQAVPVLFGGEHTVSYSMGMALFAKFGNDFSIIDFDSHGDLRPHYYGNPFSHACVMRRIHEDFKVKIMQIGTRAYCKEEALYRKNNSITTLDAAKIHSKSLPAKIIPPDFSKNIFISFDVDAFDPSIMPSTGTPEPGGLLWDETVRIIDKISSEAKIIAFDIVELAPIKSLHHSDYCAAKLAYTLMKACVKSGTLRENED